MKKFFTRTVLLFVIVLFPIVTSAHQPRIVNKDVTIVNLPEISKAYYSTLSGRPATYTITSDSTFTLYVGLLIPDLSSDQLTVEAKEKSVSAIILKDGTQIAALDGVNFEWKKFFEPFGHDTYWQGPEYRGQVEPGKYEIIISSTNNDAKYSLAIGEIEVFDFKEIMNALTLVPKIKKDFFNESPADFIFSPFGWGLIVIMFLLAFLFGFTYRALLKKFARNTVHGSSKNIGKTDRALRISIGIGLFVLAITTTWSPWLLFFSGFAFFEAFFSWCGLYAALGKSTCPIK